MTKLYAQLTELGIGMKVITLIIIPAFGFLAGILAQWFLQSRKARQDLLKELAPQRAESMKSLWKLTMALNRDPDAYSTRTLREDADQAFRRWYFDEAGALFLSWRTTKFYFKAIDCLRDDSATPKEVKLKFSKLRTELKLDCGIYTRWKDWRELPEPRPALVRSGQPKLWLPVLLGLLRILVFRRAAKAD